MKRKASTPIGVLLLGLMAAVLVFVALASFYLKDKNTEKNISDFRVVEEVYAKEEQIKFLVLQGASLEEAIKMVGGSDLVGGKPNWVQIGVQSKDMKIRVLYQFEVKKENI